LFKNLEFFLVLKKKKDGRNFIGALQPICKAVLFLLGNTNKDGRLKQILGFKMKQE